MYANDAYTRTQAWVHLSAIDSGSGIGDSCALAKKVSTTSRTMRDMW